MAHAPEIAAYIYQRYKKEYDVRIDEMKLHKLLYFAQRESFVQRGEPLFPESFEAWRYGPVMPEIRIMYRMGKLEGDQGSVSVDSSYKPVLDTVFLLYSDKDSWSLSALSHGEYSWRKARSGAEGEVHSTAPICTDDIAKDAERIKIRRFIRKSYDRIKEGSDEFLINYYRAFLHFRDNEDRGTAIPLYDYSCRFMYQEIATLDKGRQDFYQHFNLDEEDV